MDTCVFCNRSHADGEPTLGLHQQGCDGIEKASIAGEGELITVVVHSVHIKCLRDYTNPLIIKSYRKHTANEIGTDDSSKDAESMSTKATQSHDVQNISHEPTYIMRNKY